MQNNQPNQMNDLKYSIEDLELDYEGGQDFFKEFDDQSYKKYDENEQKNAKAKDEHSTELCISEEAIKVEDHGVPNGYGHSKANNPGHIFQEMAIVKRRIEFDEQAFREECHLKSVELSQKFKG
jgi:hypothetical protein